MIRNKEDIKNILITTIKEMYGKIVYNSDDNLYKPPYSLKAYDIIYILIAVFDRLEYQNIEVNNELLDKTTFSTVDSITQFLVSISMHQI